MYLCFSNGNTVLQLNLPAFDCKIKQKEEKLYIYDVLRKKYIVLLPEEWVRQHVVNYLVSAKKVSKLHIKVEQGRKYAGRQKRCDVIVWDADMNPLLMVECKAPHIEIDHKTIFQIGIYNSILQSQYLWLTNGLKHHYYKKEGEEYIPIGELPDFSRIS